MIPTETPSAPGKRDNPTLKQLVAMAVSTTRSVDHHQHVDQAVEGEVARFRSGCDFQPGPITTALLSAFPDADIVRAQALGFERLREMGVEL